MKDEDPKYTYYRVEYNFCVAVEYDYTICRTMEEVMEALKVVDTDFEDQENESSATVTGIAMTEKEYTEWVTENED